MAGDWMKVEHSTPDKPEILAIAARMKIVPDQVFGICFRMWRWFDQHTENGNARGVTPALLNQLLGVTGFAEAAIIEEWLFETESGLSLPNFDRHNGKTAKARALTYTRVQSHRKKTKRDCNATRVTEALPENREQRTENPPPLPLLRDTKTEEEEEEVQKVVRILRAEPYQVNDARTAVEAALASGCTLPEIHAIAAKWLRAGRWSQAQLHHRIAHALPGESPETNWPPPDAAKQRVSRRGTGDPETDAINREFIERERTRRANRNQAKAAQPIAAS